MTVGLSRLGSTNGAWPEEIWRARKAAANVSSKRLGTTLMQSSIVTRAIVLTYQFGNQLRVALADASGAVSCCFNNTGQFHQGNVKVLINNNIFELR
jgi:hypothetical protein